MNEFEKKVAEFIAAEGLLSPGQKVLLAVSGGADSTALLYVMASLRLDICCAHINHQLRGDEANRDEDFVIEQCRKLKVPAITGKIDVRGYAKKAKLSIETAARKLRIENLLEMAGEQNCSLIATAHHKNDNAETIIHRLSRGTGFRGLCGIWPVKEFKRNIRFIRPLLCVDRSQIIEYLKKQGIKWCEDRTNLDIYYRRNFIRNRLIPDLQKDFKNNIVEQLAQLSKSAQAYYKIINRKADVIWPVSATVEENNVTLNLNVLTKELDEIKVEIIRRALVHFKAGEQDLTQKHYENILHLRDGSVSQLPGRLIVSRQGAKIIFERYLKPSSCRAGFSPPAQLNIPGKTEFAGFLIEAEIFDYDKETFKKFRETKSSYVEWFDLDKIKPPVLVRQRKNGDRFRPLGLAGEKRIGKFLTTAKVSFGLKQKLFVIADEEIIIWLCPVRLSEKVKVANETKKVLQIKVTS